MTKFLVGVVLPLSLLQVYTLYGQKVTFEPLRLGQGFGAAAGNSPGDVIFTESEIPVSVETFVGGVSSFNLAQIDLAFSKFGSGQTMRTKDLNLKFDFSNLVGPVAQVEFVFADLGGIENVAVNDDSVVYFGELTQAPKTISAGITFSVSNLISISGGIRGTATLSPTTGKINSLMIGGQVFWIDNIIVTLVLPVLVQQGWNIISVPLLADDMSTTSLFPSASSSAFGFSGGYVTAATLQNGKGYWLKFDGSETVSIAGSAVGVNTIPVSSGWNLIGPYDYDVSVSDITSTPTGIIESAFFGFSGGYQLASTLESGKGYWLKMSTKGVLELTGGTLVKAGIFDHSNELLGHQDRARIVFEDTGGGKVTLYAAKEEMNLSRYELPPVPPTGIFDVRYTTGRNVELIGLTGKEIQISSADYPIRISVEGIELRVTEPVSGGLLQNRLQSGEVLVINDPQIKVIKIEAEAAEPTVQIPQDYELYQNYPNPFNPTTIIKFSLPEAGKVELSIYNMLGERVLELANQEFQAGFHHLEFQAQGFASGIYLYKIEAGNFREIRKMTILK